MSKEKTIYVPQCPRIMTSWPEAEACCPDYCRPICFVVNGCVCECHHVELGGES